MFIFCFLYLLFGKNGDLVGSQNLACNLNFLRKNNIIRQNIQLDLKYWKLFYKVKHFKLVYANMGFPGTSTGKNSTCIYSRSPALWEDSLPSKPPGKAKNAGVGSLSLLQGIFQTQESNWHLLHCRLTEHFSTLTFQ